MNKQIESIEFEIVPNDAGLEIEAKNSLELAFGGFFEKAAEWKKQALTITDPKLARAARLEIKALRIEADKKRKELKADSLRMSRAIDGANNILLSLIVPIENTLTDIEKLEERRIAAEKQALYDSRLEQFTPFHNNDMPLPDFGSMTDEQFEATLSDAQTLAKIKADEAARIEAERIAAEKKQAEEREAQRIENIELKKQAEAREKEIEAERVAAEKIRKAQEVKAQKERAKIEAEAKKQAEARALAEKEAQKLRDIEAAREVKEQADKQAADKAEAHRIAKEKAESKKAANAPDKDKLMKFANEVRNLATPALKTKEAQSIAADVDEKIKNFAAWIEKQATKLD